MDSETKEIESVNFGIFSPDEILKMSVAKIHTTKLTGHGSVYDERMGGSLEGGKLCITCGLGAKDCPGHFGHIELNQYIIHPLYHRMVVSFLKCFCIKCYSILIMKDQILLYGLNRFKSEKRFNKILEVLEKIDTCSKCSNPQPKIAHSSTDNAISMVYKQKNGPNVVIILMVEEIKKTFDNVSDDDVETLGFNPSRIHPKNLILSVLPVLPPTARPFVVADGNICDDDLTNQYTEIIKSNNHLEDPDMTDTKQQKYIQSLKFRILTFFNNCLHPNTPVLLWSGNIKKAKDIIVGDEIVGDDGDKRIVESTCDGEDEMFEIKQKKGDSYIVNSNHILTLTFSGHKNIFWVKANSNSPLGSYWMKWYDNSIKKIKSKVISVTNKRTKEQALELIEQYKKTINISDTFDISIKDYLKCSKSITKFFMGFKLKNPINWVKKQVLIDPYTLGMWLGDGNSDGKGFTSEDKDWALLNESEIVLHPCKLPENNTYNFTYRDYQINDPEKFRPDIHYGIKSKFNTGNYRKHPSPLKLLLNEYNLIKNKHIPDDYLYNDEKTRLQLLAGIIDTDGNVCEEGTNITISQSIIREKLIKQIQFLAKSLGFCSTIHEKTITKNDKKYEQLVVHISGYGIDKIPTLLQQKKCLNPKERDTLNSGISINSIGIGKYNGFTVDKNNRFLLGDFTVTHNSQGKAKHTTNGRPIKGIKERLTGKDGQIRNNLMGKRVEQSGRTVIGPDPTLRMGQLALPREMATNLTIPENVTSFNINKLTDLVNSGNANFVLRNGGKTRINLQYALFQKGTDLLYGDIVIRKGRKGEIKIGHVPFILENGDIVKRNGKVLDNVIYAKRKRMTLNIGDIVERHIQDGDIVLLNRQPTLHSGSMMAKEVVVRDGKTIRMNLACTKSFNADFDGDEINVSLKQAAV